MQFELTASMMCANYGNLEQEVRALEEGGIDSFHIDIMDGRYVPNFAMSLNDMRYIAGATSKPLDVHLMIEHPNNHINLFLKNLRKGDTVYIHPEAEYHPSTTLQTIIDAGMVPGIAINPGTSVETVLEMLRIVKKVLVMSVNIVFTPFWSAFTDAYVKQEYTWMKNARNKLEIMGLLCIPVAVLMVLLSNFLYTYWIGSEVDIPISLSAALAIFAIAQTFGGIYVTLLNGTGKVRIQMLAYLFSSFVALPAMYVSYYWFGLEGIVLFPSIVCFLQAILGRVQLKRIINNTACGIWNK